MQQLSVPGNSCGNHDATAPHYERAHLVLCLQGPKAIDPWPTAIFDFPGMSKRCPDANNYEQWWLDGEPCSRLYAWMMLMPCHVGSWHCRHSWTVNIMTIASCIACIIPQAPSP
jgi:hypothetical protein